MNEFPHPGPALIVIDVQRAFDEWEAAANGVTIQTPSGASRNCLQPSERLAPRYSMSGTKVLSPAPPFCPETQVICQGEAREREGEPVITKRVNSSFIGTVLKRRLDRLVSKP